jgi:sulfopyruvate decarboxylase subunit beta
MKRYGVLKEFVKRLNDDDIAIFSGEDMCKEAFQYDREGNFYITSGQSIAPSLATGIASGTNKRIFIFSGEGNFLREAGALIQMFVSQQKNLIYVMLDNGCYQSSGGYNNIFNEMDNPKGLFYNIGFILHDFTYYFEGKKFLKNMKQFMDDMIGPLVIMIKTSKGLKRNLDDIPYSETYLKKRIKNFINGSKE